MNDNRPLLPDKSTPSLQREVVAMMFTTMQAMYPDRFLKPGENLPDKAGLWQYYLRLTGESAIRHAMDQVPAAYPSHPPTIGEFMKLIPTSAISGEGATLCRKCHGHFAGQLHADQCGDGKYHP